MLQYLRSDFDESGATFAVAREADIGNGKGRCVPDRSSCDFLKLGVGEQQYLGYGGRTYRIELGRVVRHERVVSEGGGS